MLISGPQYNAVGSQLKLSAFHTLTCASVFSSHTDSLRSGCHYMLRTAVFTPLRVTCRGLPHPDRPCLARNSVFNTPAGSVIQLSLPNQACVPNALISPIQCPCIGSIQRCRVKLNEFCTEPVSTILEGLLVSKDLFVLAVCIFEMKLTILERVQAQGCPVT